MCAHVRRGRCTGTHAAGVERGPSVRVGLDVRMQGLLMADHVPVALQVRVGLVAPFSL